MLAFQDFRLQEPHLIEQSNIPHYRLQLVTLEPMWPKLHPLLEYLLGQCSLAAGSSLTKDSGLTFLVCFIVVTFYLSLVDVVALSKVEHDLPHPLSRGSLGRRVVEYLVGHEIVS